MLNSGKVSGWWVVAAAAAPILADLVTEPSWRVGLFVMFLVMFSIIVFPLWSITKEEM